MGVPSNARQFAPMRRGYNWVRRQAFARGNAPNVPSELDANARPTVFVLGIYLADRSNSASHLVRRFVDATRFSETQRRVPLSSAPPDAAVGAVTVERVAGFVLKF